MKKILFVCYGLGIGGIEKCLVNLLNDLDSSKYEIDILPMNPEFELKNQIKKDINILDTYKYSMNTIDTYMEYKKEVNRIKKIVKIIKYFIFRIVNKFGRKPWKIFEKIEEKYDIAIAYSQNDFSPYYVIDKVKADKKYMWYHNGSYDKLNKYYSIDKEYYSKFNNIITVSNDCKSVLLSRFECLKDKILVIENIINSKEILQLSEENQDREFDKSYISIVTVGRLAKEKGADLAVDACKQLVDKGYKVNWYWIGNGNQYNTINNKITELGIKNNFHLLGNKINPYTYMKNCDIYVQPSYYEAYCTTTNEARILAKPIIVTDVGGMRDQFIDNKTALIVPIDSISLYCAVEKLIKNDKLRNQLVSNLKNQTYKFDNYINKYDDLFYSV